MGLTVWVYRNDLGDCTLNGVSSNARQLCVVNVDGPFNPADNSPAVLLEQHHPGCLRLVPAIKAGNEWVVKPEWSMFGGNYGATSDSRFSEACERLLGHRFYGAVPIHDRYE